VPVKSILELIYVVALPDIGSVSDWARLDLERPKHPR
jgi:hypothetical protein